MSREPQALARLAAVARMLSDRDLGAVAKARAQIAAADERLEKLDAMRRTLRQAAPALSDPDAWLRHQRYDDFLRASCEALETKRMALIAAVAEVMPAARRSFARASVLDNLTSEAVRRQKDARSRTP